MARPLRIDYPGAIYHITDCGNERRAIFGDDADRLAFQERLATCVSTYQLRVHGKDVSWRRTIRPRVGRGLVFWMDNTC
jgi:REP element-mobilizing transposase RayT